MILRLHKNIFFHCKQKHLIKFINNKLIFYKTVQNEFKKCFKFKSNQKIRLFYTLKLFGFCGTGSLFFFK